MEQAGADALELNIYYIPVDPKSSGDQVEQQYVDLVQAVEEQVTIPVAVKLGPYFSSMANMARKLDAAGADGLVLFNRFYQPDFDLEALEVVPNLILSNSARAAAAAALDRRDLRQREGRPGAHRRRAQRH